LRLSEQISGMIGFAMYRTIFAAVRGLLLDAVFG
jgi:hypothetical protein